MLCLQVPNGIATADQLNGFASMVARYGNDGVGGITSLQYSQALQGYPNNHGQGDGYFHNDVVFHPVEEDLHPPQEVKIHWTGDDAPHGDSPAEHGCSQQPVSLPALAALVLAAFAATAPATGQPLLSKANGADPFHFSSDLLLEQYPKAGKTDWTINNRILTQNSAAPVLSTAAVNGRTLVLIYQANLDTTSVPSAFDTARKADGYGQAQ